MDFLNSDTVQHLIGAVRCPASVIIHAYNVDPAATGAHRPRLRSYQTVALEESQQLGLEAVWEQDRPGAAKGLAGERLGRPGFGA